MNNDDGKLQKQISKTGQWSYVLSIVSLIAEVLLSALKKSSIQEVLPVLVTALIFYAPFYYFGRKLKIIGITDLPRVKKISFGMLIYGVIFVIMNLMAGGVGWLWLFVVYDYYKTYQGVKKSN